jgi:hypothetical protein
VVSETIARLAKRRERICETVRKIEAGGGCDRVEGVQSAVQRNRKKAGQGFAPDVHVTYESTRNILKTFEARASRPK